jgi:hypothetical protein
VEHTAVVSGHRMNTELALVFADAKNHLAIRSALFEFLFHIRLGRKTVDKGKEQQPLSRPFF